MSPDAPPPAANATGRRTSDGRCAQAETTSPGEGISTEELIVAATTARAEQVTTRERFLRTEAAADLAAVNRADIDYIAALSQAIDAHISSGRPSADEATLRALPQGESLMLARTADAATTAALDAMTGEQRSAPRARPTAWLDDRDAIEAILVDAAVWHGVALPPGAAELVRDPLARQVLETLSTYDGPDPLRHLDDLGVPVLELIGLWCPPWPWTIRDAVEAALHRLRAWHAQDRARGDLVAALDELDRGDLDAAKRRLTAAGARVGGGLS